MTPLDPDLLKAVLADPDDDAVRLAASDWWEEHGEGERAEFIRVQVELARLEADYERTRLWTRPRLHHRKRDALRRREGELLDAQPDELQPCNRYLWFPLADQLDWRADRFDFRRGFIEHVTCEAADWLAHAGAVLAACPIRQRNAGTAERPVWVQGTGGLVTLTTWPELEYHSAGRHNGHARLSGRKTWHRYFTPRLHVSEMLAAEWPGVAFKLPPAGESAGLTAANAEGVAVTWRDRGGALTSARPASPYRRYYGPYEGADNLP